MKNFIRNILILSLTVGLNFSLIAQPQYYNYNTTGSGNAYPFNVATGKKVQVLFRAGEFNQPSAAPGGSINSIAFMVNQDFGPYSYSDMTVKLGQTTDTTFLINNSYTGTMTTVYYRSSVTLSGTSGQWMTFILDNAFPYNPNQSLVLELEHCAAPGAIGFTLCTTLITNYRRTWTTNGCPNTFLMSNDMVYHTGISFAPTGIEETTAGKFSIYPVPNDGYFTVSIDCPAQASFNIAVYNEMGEMVYQDNNIPVIGLVNRDIDIRSLPAGVYSVVFTNNKNKIVNKLLVSR